MIRRSLLIFLIAVILGLGLTVGYALTGLAGPAATIGEAEAALARGAHADAVRILDMTERSPALAEKPALRRRLHLVRYRAQLELDNARRALRDLEQVLALTERPEPELLLDQISLLARLDQGEDALLAARNFVGRNPDHARGLELAGEAAQVAYRESLRRIADTVRRDLAGPDQTVGTQALLHYLYRPEGDVDQAGALTRLAALYDDRQSRQQAWPTVHPRLRELRPRIQEGLEFYRRSLEAGGQPVAAFRGLAFALQQADRIDDVVALGEIYLLRFDHRFAAEAAGLVAVTHMGDGLLDAAADLVRRFLPPGSAIPRYEQQKLDEGAHDLLFTAATAHFRRGDRTAMDALARDTRALVAAGVRVPLANHWANGLLALMRDDARGAEANLTIVTNSLMRQGPPARGEDPLDTAMALRLQLMRRRGAPDGEFTEVINAWAGSPGRADRLEPAMARVRLQLETGRASAAMGSVGELLRLRPQDERVLGLLAEAATASYRPSGQDGAGLLAQCQRRRILVPDVPHPVCLLLTAEAALSARIATVARECARKAQEKFAWSIWPRLLEARALLLANQPAEAATLLERALQVHPGNAQALSLLLQARERAGQPFRGLLFDIVRTCPPDTYIAEGMLRSALATSDETALRALGAGAARIADPSATLLALQSRALARTGDATGARDALQRAFATAGASASTRTRTDLLEAGLELLVLQAASTPDDELLQEAQTTLRRCRATGPTTHAALLRAAAMVAARQRPRTGLACALAAIDLLDGEQLRNGAAFQLAGELAQDTGQLQLAEDLWTAAVSFADGVAAAEPLARLTMLAGRTGKAAAALRMVTEPGDPALLLRLGDGDRAAALAEARRKADPTDLVARSVLALAQTGSTDSFAEQLAGLPQPDRARLLELLSAMQVPALARAHAADLRALAARLADTVPVQLLWARFCNHSDAGAEAGAIHARLFADGCRDPSLFADAIAGTAWPGYRMPLPIAAASQARAIAADPTVSRSERAHALRAAAAEAGARGRTDLAHQILLDLWLAEDPAVSGLRLVDALALLRLPGVERQALFLLDRLQPRLQGEELTTCLDTLFQLADGLAAAGDARIAASAARTARTVLQQRGPRAAPIWFLLRDRQRRPPAATAPAGVQEEPAGLLAQALDAVASGRDRMSWARQLLLHLRATQGDAACLQAGEEFLRQRPSALDVWLLRAELLAPLQRAAEAAADLRRLMDYAEDRALLLSAVAYAGRHRSLRPTDPAALDRLPDVARSGVAWRWARGLVALRSGDGDRAEALLADLPPQADGAPLYFRALANLIRRGPEARENARSLFAQLAADYPSSSLARYAGSFARQLAVSP